MAARTLTLLQINDTHGYLEPHPELVWDPDGRPRHVTLGGYARLATLFRQAREENPGRVVVLDNGDTLHGTFAAVHSKGEALVEPLNALGIDAMTAHWEFAWGADHLRQLARAAAASAAGDQLLRQGHAASSPSRPATMLERDGLRIGVIGIAATIVDKTMPPHFPRACASRWARRSCRSTSAACATEGADLVVVLSHLGLPQDVKLASRVPGIDVLLSGHTHNRLAEPIHAGGAVLIQSGCHGSFVGRLDLEIAEGGGLAGFAHRLVAGGRCDPGRPGDAGHGRRHPGAAPRHARPGRRARRAPRWIAPRCWRRPWTRCCCARSREAAGTQIAFSNGWRYGAPVPPGPVTMNDLWNIIPTNPPVSVVELTGAEIRAMLEENLERTFAADPYAQMGGYAKRCLGLRPRGEDRESDGPPDRPRLSRKARRWIRPAATGSPM